MKIQEIESKSIISKTGIPSADYVINPYIGCSHSCFYCYARFMKRFTGHKENWGDFMDVKINAPDLVPVLKDYKSSKYNDKRILLSSVTDPYNPLERKYKLTRKILEKLIPHQPHLNILTKSDLVTRDLDLLKQFENIEIGFSFSTLVEDIRRKVEPGALPIKNRLNALKIISEAHITSYVFISPIIPFIINWKDIISQTRGYADFYMFENLNIVGNVWGSVNRWLKTEFSDIIQDYRISILKIVYFGRKWKKKSLHSVKLKSLNVKCTSITDF